MVELLKNWKGTLKIKELNVSHKIYKELIFDKFYKLIDEQSFTHVYEYPRGSNPCIEVTNLISGLKFLSDSKILENITEIFINDCTDINEIIKYKDEFISLKKIKNRDWSKGQLITQTDLKMLLSNFPKIEFLNIWTDYLITDFDFSILPELKYLNLYINFNIKFENLIEINNTYFQPLIDLLPKTIETLYLSLPYFNCVLPELPKLKKIGVKTIYYIWRYGDDNIKLKNTMELFTKSLPPGLTSLIINIPYFDGEIPELPFLSKLVISSKLFTKPLNLKAPLKEFKLYCKNFNHSLHFPDTTKEILLYRYYPDKTKTIHAPSVEIAVLEMDDNLFFDTIENGGFANLKEIILPMFGHVDEFEAEVQKFLPECEVSETYNIDDVELY